MNLSALLFDHPFTDDQPLLHGPDRSWTAGEARSEVVELAGSLATAGVEPDRLVAVELTGCPMVIAMMAIWRHGGVFVPVNDRLPDAAVAPLLERTGVAATIGTDGVRVLGPGQVHETGAAFVLFTSGTTGEPKAIVHHHQPYLEIIDRVLGPLAATRDRSKPPSPNLIPVPMALNAGIYNALFGLRAGAPLVLMDRFTPAEFARLVNEHAIRSTVLPPAAIAMLSDDGAIDDLSPLRYVRSITAPLSPFQARRFTDRFGAFVLNGYGQAELGEVIGWTAADAKTHPDKIGAAGRPHPGVEIRLEQPDGEGVGELLVRPPHHAAGYADGSDLSDRLSTDGFVHTGDLARIDAEGFVWIEGRLGSLINRGGNKVYPAEVEEVLRTVAGVREAAVVGAADDRLGQVPVAFLSGSAGDIDLDRICRNHLVPYKVPVRFEWIDHLPRNDAGKVLRTELEALA